MYNQMGALHMHRSASEGFLRSNAYAPGLGREGSLQSHETSNEMRGGRDRASGMQEEVSYRANSSHDQPRGLLTSRMNETPDFAMIYAFLGSMFDPVSALCRYMSPLNGPF